MNALQGNLSLLYKQKSPICSHRMILYINLIVLDDEGFTDEAFLNFNKALKNYFLYFSSFHFDLTTKKN